MENILDIMSKSTSLRSAHAAAVSSPDKAGILISFAKKMHTLKSSKTGGKYIEDVMENVFGKNNAQLPGEAPDRGQFFKVNYTDKGPLLTLASEEDKSNASIAISFGIDTNGQKYLNRYLKDLQPLLPKKIDGTVIVYHYDTSAGKRADFFGKLMQNHYSFPDEAKIFAEFLALNPDKPKVHIAHSYGGVFDRMTRNALAHMSAKSGVDLQKNLHSLVVGTFPVWGQGGKKEQKERKRQHFSEFQESSSLFIISVDDLLPYLPDYAHAAVLNAAKTMYNGEKPYIAYHHPLNSNKVVVILAHGVVPTVTQGKPNFAGHGFAHYVQALCAPEHHGIVLGSEHGTELSMLQATIQELLTPSVVQSGVTLKDRLSARLLNKEEMKALDSGVDHYLATALSQLLKEDGAYTAAGYVGGHPLVSGPARK